MNAFFPFQLFMVYFHRSTALPVVPNGRGRLSGLVHRPVELFAGTLPAGGGQGRPSGWLKQRSLYKGKTCMCFPLSGIYS